MLTHDMDSWEKEVARHLAELVGPGPAAYFRDAARLMRGYDQIESVGLIVGHLMREVESALRAVLRPIAEKGCLESGVSSDTCERSRGPGAKKEIQCIVQALYTSPEDEIERKNVEMIWRKLQGSLHKIAHRRALDPPRTRDEVSEQWETFIKLLPPLLNAIRERAFARWVPILDEILESDPSDGSASRLRQNIPWHPVLRAYFFERLNDPRWLPLLRKHGFFCSPPPMIRDESTGQIYLQPWPEGEYLARMADKDPKLVAKVVTEVPHTDNAFAIHPLVRAAKALPASLSAGLVEKAKAWATISQVNLPLELASLAVRWAQSGHSSEALELMHELLKVSVGDEGKELIARFDDFIYQTILREYLPEIARIEPRESLSLLVQLLKDAIQIKLSSDDAGDDASVIWRPSIEPSHQNVIRDDLLNTLVDALRDNAEALVENNKVDLRWLIYFLEKESLPIFKRIALHLIRVFYESVPDLAEERITARELFDDTTIRHEYVLLLRAGFDSLPGEKREEILGWIQAGPTRFESKEHANVDYWRLERLAWIGRSKLPSEFQRLYDQLSGKFGEPAHPEFVYYVEISEGPKAPISKEELFELSIEELVYYLQGFKPSDGFAGPSIEGLGRVLEEVVQAKPLVYAPFAERFKGLDPTYIRSFFSGLVRALERDEIPEGKFPWKAVLSLAKWVVAQPRAIKDREVKPLEADPDWGWTRNAILRLLQKGFQKGSNETPISERQMVWSILDRLAQDADPTPDKDDRQDPFTIALNATRPLAIDSILLYAFWVSRNTEGAGGFVAVPEARYVLETHLDPEADPSPAIRTVFGRCYLSLRQFDSEWVRAQRELIFPDPKKYLELWEAAWGAFLLFSQQLPLRLKEELYQEYRRSVDHMGQWTLDSRFLHELDRALGLHLLSYYLYGAIELDDPIFKHFWEKASEQVRAEVVRSVYGQLRDLKRSRLTEDQLYRLREFWKARLEHADEKELEAFASWFPSGAFDPSFAVQAFLETSSRIARLLWLSNDDLHWLHTSVNDAPKEVAEVLKLYGERGGMEHMITLRNHIDQVKTILSRILEEPSARLSAQRAVNVLVSRGLPQLAELLS